MQQNQPDGTLQWDIDAHEHYVPVHARDLVHFLAQVPHLSGETIQQFRQMTEHILAKEHHLYREQYEQILYAYAPMDPDLDHKLTSVPTVHLRERLIEQIRTDTQIALERANYKRLDLQELAQSLNMASEWGVRMKINFGLQDWMDVYTRGYSVSVRQRRSWRTLFRQQSYKVPLYQRLVVVFRAKENHPQKFTPLYVYFRMFKNVPRHDVDMMLPGAGVHLTWIDHSKIVLPSIYAASITLWRVLKSFLMLVLIGAFKTIGIFIISVLAIGYGIKNMFTFRLNTQRRYLLNMTQNLYYQSLGNNFAVLLRLLEEGKQQASCQKVLVYFAALESMPSPISNEDIRRRTQEIIAQITGIQTQLDLQSSIQSLVEYGILLPSGDGWIVADTAGYLSSSTS